MCFQGRKLEQEQDGTFIPLLPARQAYVMQGYDATFKQKKEELNRKSFLDPVSNT